MDRGTDKTCPQLASSISFDLFAHSVTSAIVSCMIHVVDGGTLFEFGHEFPTLPVFGVLKL